MQKRRKELLRGWCVLFLSGIHRLHIAHRRRADVGANEKEVVRSTAVFASAERGHRAPRDTTGIRPYPALHRPPTSHTAGVQMWGQMKKRRCVARLFLRVPNGGIAPRAIPPGYAPYPAMSDRNNINEIRKRSNISYFRNMTHL